MKFSGDLVISGYVVRHGFSGNEDKFLKIVQFVDGVDSVRFFVNDDALFDHIKTIPPFTRCKIEVDYNPAASRATYALSLVDVVPIKS